MAEAGVFEFKLQRELMRFSFGWLVVANCVGVLLAWLLLFPGSGGILGPLTYGRLMPLHMEWQLYGWCSLPLVGLLFKEFIVAGRGSLADVRFALVAWSLGLLAGGTGFLAAQASGKLFLSWSGFSRIFFPLCLVLVWSVLATHWLRQWGRGECSRGRMLLRAALLACLAAVPVLLYWSASRSVYPPVNPESGGATGHSLLASTLGLLGMIAAVPLLLGRSRRPSRAFGLFWGTYALLWLAYAIINHGNASNTEAGQVAGLGSLLLILPLLFAYMRLWQWPAGCGPWVAAFLGWWISLTLNGWLTFLPGILDRLKFTNSLVAHAHLAMAGMVTSLGFILLFSLHEDKNPEPARAAGGWDKFLIWNGACIAMVLVLFIQGWREGANPGVLFGRDVFTTFIYFIRLMAGIAMLTVSFGWFMRAMRKGGTACSQ